MFGSGFEAAEQGPLNFCVKREALFTLWQQSRSDGLRISPAIPNASPSTATPPDGQRVSNITEWGLRMHQRPATASRLGRRLTTPENRRRRRITAEDIFAYTYAVLHDPEYREKYAVDLLREFPAPAPARRLPRLESAWARKLLDLHIGFESAKPYLLERVEKSGPAGKPVLRADKGARSHHPRRQHRTHRRPRIRLAIPRLGSRSALEWVLDQYKERKPRDPTIAARFDTYRFAGHKERVIDLLQRVCTVSVETARIVERMSEIAETG